MTRLAPLAKSVFAIDSTKNSYVGGALEFLTRTRPAAGGMGPLANFDVGGALLATFLRRELQAGGEFVRLDGSIG